MSLIYTTQNMTSVPMNGGEYSNEGLTTKGLNGCFAVISRTKNGRNIHGIMTHYEPTQLEPHLQRLNRLLGLYVDDIEQDNTKVVVFHPKMGQTIDALARKIKENFERISKQNEIVKIIPYPIEQEHILFTGTEGILNFDVFTGRYDFEPFTAREGYNPDFHNFL